MKMKWRKWECTEGCGIEEEHQGYIHYCQQPWLGEHIEYMIIPDGYFILSLARDDQEIVDVGQYDSLEEAMAAAKKHLIETRDKLIEYCNKMEEDYPTKK